MNKKEPVKGWTLISSSPALYTFEIDERVFYSGQRSGLLYAEGGASNRDFATIMQRFQASKYLEKHIKMSCYLKADQGTKCQAWLQINDSYDDVIRFGSMNNCNLLDTSDWNHYSITLDVPKASVSILFGVQIFGVGKVWVNNFNFEEII